MEEFPTMVNLQHENILKIYAFGKGSYRRPDVKTKNVHYAVMELAEGGTLFDYVQASKGFDETTAKVYFKQCLNALLYCHS